MLACMCSAYFLHVCMSDMKGMAVRSRWAQVRCDLPDVNPALPILKANASFLWGFGPTICVCALFPLV